jgi:hypothetical protein
LRTRVLMLTERAWPAARLSYANGSLLLSGTMCESDMKTSCGRLRGRGPIVGKRHAVPAWQHGVALGKLPSKRDGGTG